MDVTRACLSRGINYRHKFFKVAEKKLIEKDRVLLLETLQEGAFPQGCVPG
jgi:hypothetical protein